ncbi:hypothetical protein [Amycolatopsis sp. CA-230715]|uniref:hypothetical protein n=1 Tax=Amycolatopsis sp. CA-230715 TaxID=2745196 RepID=UPI001C02486C|nr:hypothetical protein [Amycolatopsis sp. CA-230715]QWF85709.1 hypothetical protein HUW46_09189 [Amycolatopsis sp. CA-230715]
MDVYSPDTDTTYPSWDALYEAETNGFVVVCVLQHAHRKSGRTTTFARTSGPFAQRNTAKNEAARLRRRWKQRAPQPDEPTLLVVTIEPLWPQLFRNTRRRSRGDVSHECSTSAGSAVDTYREAWLAEKKRADAATAKLDGIRATLAARHADHPHAYSTEVDLTTRRRIATIIENDAVAFVPCAYQVIPHVSREDGGYCLARADDGEYCAAHAAAIRARPMDHE